jgi:hypothetical protein
MENIKIFGSKKGQITLVNLFGFFITIIVYAILAPMINDATLPVVAYFQANPNPVSPTIILLIQMLSFVILLAIIMSALSQAIPRREGY